jgi:WD40 repeat protein
VTASNDKTARLWDGVGQELAVLEGHTEPVRSAVFSADGERIVTASDDKTVRLWDGKGRALAVLAGHSNWINSAVFRLDGERIVSAGNDNTARLWRVFDDVQSMLVEAEQLLARLLTPEACEETLGEGLCELNSTDTE